MTRGWKIALGIAAGLLAISLALRALQGVTGGSPGGPASSSYATGGTGAEAYAELLARAGHEVRRERATPAHAVLDPGATAVVLDPPLVVRRDAAALRAFVAAGGRLVAADDGSGWLKRVLPGAPAGDAQGVARPHRLAPVPELSHVETVRTAGDHAWHRVPGMTAALGSADGRIVLAVATRGNGRVVALADSSPLQNQLLASADNAQLALGLAGPAGRPVVFFESYHGYGRGSGLSALPGSWKALLALGAAAALVFLLAHVRRLGPPEAEERPLDPPRRAYVEAVAATVARTRDRTTALDPLRDEVRRRIAVRAGLRPDAPAEEVAAAARRLGLADDEVEAVVRGPRGEAGALAAGRALARLAERRDGWRS